MRVIRAPTWNRSVLEGDPIGCWRAWRSPLFAVGASRASIYIRADTPWRSRTCRGAIGQPSGHRLLGELFDSSFEFTVELQVRGWGLCLREKETALIHSIEGKRGTPQTNGRLPGRAGVGACPP